MLDTEMKMSLDLEDFRSYRQKEHELWIACGKALMILHSAGVAAMLGFMQALVGKGQLSAFKVFGCPALVFYLIGTLCGLLVLRRRTDFAAMMATAQPTADEAHPAGRNATKIGVLLFVIASLVATPGVVFALK